MNVNRLDFEAKTHQVLKPYVKVAVEVAVAPPSVTMLQTLQQFSCFLSSGGQTRDVRPAPSFSCWRVHKTARRTFKSVGLLRPYKYSNVDMLTDTSSMARLQSSDLTPLAKRKHLYLYCNNFYLSYFASLASTLPKTWLGPC